MSKQQDSMGIPPPERQPVGAEQAKKRQLCQTFWGKSWCRNLDGYEAYQGRLPAGRSILRRGGVLDLRIEPGLVLASVAGRGEDEAGELAVHIRIDACPEADWRALQARCAGAADSLVALLQGQVSPAVLAHLAAPEHGLFPDPAAIHFGCTCTDYAEPCAHAAAALYAVGLRLDDQPELLFTLRGLRVSDLLASATQLDDISGPAAGETLGQLGDADLGALFGLDLDPELA